MKYCFCTDPNIKKHQLPLFLGDPVEIVPEGVVIESDYYRMDYDDMMTLFTVDYDLASLMCFETTELFVLIQPSVVTEVNIQNYWFGISTPYGSYGVCIIFNR